MDTEIGVLVSILRGRGNERGGVRCNAVQRDEKILACQNECSCRARRFASDCDK